MPESIVHFKRSDILPESSLPVPAELMATGQALSRDWTVQSCEFLKAYGVGCEADYKRQQIHSGRIMQHAHMGFRDAAKSQRAFAEIYETAYKKGICIDRYGICLDWSMGYPRSVRQSRMQGTGVVLNSPEEFSWLTNSAPVASHFGDFMLGFPAAVENVQYALSAGVTTIGNLGQYFSFQLPDWKDDIETTRATLTAIALMAAQPVDVLVHSNLDDGFAGVLGDLCCALGAAAIERYLIEDLMGGKVTHCYGHHYSTPELRYAFQLALSEISPQPGSMVYGNTTSYRGSDAENYASLAGYLLVDIAAQRANPSGHAINPVPVTENQRIPDIPEIIEAQLFAGRMMEISAGFDSVVDHDVSESLRQTLVKGAGQFKQNLLHGFQESGIDIRNPVEMFLAIRRIGGRKLERWFGPGMLDDQGVYRIPLVKSDTLRELSEAVSLNLGELQSHNAEALKGTGLKVMVATTDVHEHSKMLVEQILAGLGLSVIDGGVSVDADDLARKAEEFHADAIALSSYNGVALTYFVRLKDELDERELHIPVMIGGQLNEIPEDSETSLPVDVVPELLKLGAIPCQSIKDMMPCLVRLAGRH